MHRSALADKATDNESSPLKNNIAIRKPITLHAIGAPANPKLRYASATMENPMPPLFAAPTGSTSLISQIPSSMGCSLEFKTRPRPGVRKSKDLAYDIPHSNFLFCGTNSTVKAVAMKVVPISCNTAKTAVDFSGIAFIARMPAILSPAGKFLITATTGIVKIAPASSAAVTSFGMPPTRRVQTNKKPLSNIIAPALFPTNSETETSIATNAKSVIEGRRLGVPPARANSSPDWNRFPPTPSIEARKLASLLLYSPSYPRAEARSW